SISPWPISCCGGLSSRPREPLDGAAAVLDSRTRAARSHRTGRRGEASDGGDGAAIRRGPGLGAASCRLRAPGRGGGGRGEAGEDGVYLICRGDHPIIAYDQKGHFIRSWGEGQFTYRTHGISVAPNGTLFCTDDGNHTIRQFTPEGKLLLTLGIMNTPSDTGYD